MTTMMVTTLRDPLPSSDFAVVTSRGGGPGDHHRAIKILYGGPNDYHYVTYHAARQQPQNYKFVTDLQAWRDFWTSLEDIDHHMATSHCVAMSVTALVLFAAGWVMKMATHRLDDDAYASWDGTTFLLVFLAVLSVSIGTFVGVYAFASGVDANFETRLETACREHNQRAELTGFRVSFHTERGILLRGSHRYVEPPPLWVIVLYPVLPG